MEELVDALEAAKAELKTKQQAMAEISKGNQEVQDAMQAEEEVRRLEHAATTGKNKLLRAFRKYFDGMKEAEETASQS